MKVKHGTGKRAEKRCFNKSYNPIFSQKFLENIEKFVFSSELFSLGVLADSYRLFPPS